MIERTCLKKLPLIAFGMPRFEKRELVMPIAEKEREKKKEKKKRAAKETGYREKQT